MGKRKRKTAPIGDLLPRPAPLLSVLVDERNRASIDLSVLHAGFETGEWRSRQLAVHVLDWLPEFALTYREVLDLGAHNAGPLMRKAAAKIFSTRYFKKRGEFGEILLHICVRQVYNSLPAISKIFFKDSANDVAKGFDMVHIVGTASSTELWMGEAKFYSNCKVGLRAATKSLESHFKSEYLKEECTFILDKVDPSHPRCDALREALHTNRSLDKIIKEIVVPVMVTYDSDCLTSFDEDCEDLFKEIRSEAASFKKWWIESCPPQIPCRIILFLIPISTKKELNRQLNEMLKVRQKHG